MRIKMLLCWVVGRWYQSVSQRWVFGLLSKVRTLHKKFREARFKYIMHRIWGLIKDYKISEPGSQPGDSIELITKVMKPATGFDIPSKYNIHSSEYSWYDFLKRILEVIIDSECIYHSTRRAFLRAIGRGVYYFEGKAEKHLKRIDLYGIISGVLDKYNIHIAKDTIMAILYKYLTPETAKRWADYYTDSHICMWLSSQFFSIINQLAEYINADSVVASAA